MPIDSAVPAGPPTRSRLQQHWRLLATPAASGAANMALDHALMQHAAGSGEWIFRVYGWARPTLSFGRNQRALALYDPVRLQAAGIGVVRRPTGGRALLHDAEVTYSVTAPVAGADGIRAVYERINRVLVHGLRALGVDAHVVSGREGRSIPPGAAPCFDHPAPGEIAVAGRKLAGSAQWRSQSALLQHGSILIAGDQRLVASLLRVPGAPPPAPATLAELLGGDVGAGAVKDALFDAVRALEDSDATALGIDEALVAETRRLREAYADAAWTWGA